MKRTSMRAGAALLAAASLTGNAWGGCVADADMAALKVAALQQELMVAAFSCHDVGLYNHFVLAHQPELIGSDGRLMAYFVQRDGSRPGEANYHTYKTELANASSLSSLRDDGFCQRADADFDATDSHAALAPALDAHRWSIETTYRACGSSGAPLLAEVSAEGPSSRTLVPSPDIGGGARLRGEGVRSTEMQVPSPHRHLSSDSL